MSNPANTHGRENYTAWTWGIAALIALALIWLWLTGRGPGTGAACCGTASLPAATAPATTTPAPASPATPATPATPTAPATNTASTNSNSAAAAAATAAMAKKPMATLYFDVGKTSAPAGTPQEIAAVVDYLLKNPASKAVISGYNDPSGNAATNAELSKNRAKSAREALKAAGIEEARVELRKPTDTNLGGDARAARRVEISVEP